MSLVLLLLLMSAVWLVLIEEQPQIVILPAVSLVLLLMSAVWLVLMKEQSQIHTGTLKHQGSLPVMAEQAKRQQK